ncbi:hypothetical protein EVAR_86128_1 [Eumeta japonica]|uniref:Uncharacterized protein n=1 Tax=Eumeta variegata TaxID=151549 RepID=A0A4C1V215_EUMVA|nr:hypothetical protein EVAR_86128_1 [Eumeta japonica]
MDSHHSSRSMTTAIHSCARGDGGGDLTPIDVRYLRVARLPSAPSRLHGNSPCAQRWLLGSGWASRAARAGFDASPLKVNRPSKRRGRKGFLMRAQIAPVANAIRNGRN